MRADEIRAIGADQLTQELEDAHRELFNLRFRHAARSLEDATQLRTARRNVARIRTIIRERELNQGGA